MKSAMADANTQYREIDTEILQKRTRAWLEAVLGEKFDDRSLAQLLADGNLLYRVSRYVTKELTGQSPGLEVISPKSFSDAAQYGKSSGKYLPYSNVDSFLKMCKKVGVTDIDLFTPPDAVESKDLRRVCLCIRALTRKARSGHIRVPDFDDVTRPLPMPTERVFEIREHLQSGTNSPLPSAASASLAEIDVEKSEKVSRPQKVQIIKKFLASTTSAPTSPAGVNGATSWKTLPSPGSDAHTPPLTAPSSDLGSMYSTPPSLRSSAPPSKQLTAAQATLSKSLSAHEPRSVHKPSSVASETRERVLKFDGVSAVPDRLLLSNHSLESGVQLPISKTSSQQASSTSIAPKIEPASSSRMPLLPADTKCESTSSSTPSTELKGTQKANVKSTGSGDQAGREKGSVEGPAKERSDSKSAGLGRTSGAANPVSRSMRSGEGLSKVVQSNGIERGASASGVRAKDAVHNTPEGEPKNGGTSTFKSLWVPLLAGLVAFVGTLLAFRSRETSVYEVKQGDTLSQISKRAGKANWEELVRLNPNIKNPHLIHPSEILNL